MDPGRSFETSAASAFLLPPAPTPAPPPQQQQQQPRQDSPHRGSESEMASEMARHQSSSPQEADLTTWFLRAKRSLSSVALCTQAHDLVEGARTALHEASVISSRCVFLRASLADQLAVASQIHKMMHSTQEAARVEFEKTLTELDNADIRLNQTLNLLRNSEVDPAFQSPDAAQQGDANASAAPSASASAAASEERARAATGGAGNYPNSDTSEDTPAIARPRVLHDFVEDEGIENLKSRLRHSIDYVQESHDALHSSINMFDGSLKSLSASLNALHDPSPQSERLHPPLHELEQNTEAMASLLASLTEHYDRCSLALKATEAGTPVDPDLFLVLSRDAAEVDDVVTELGERLEEMEAVSASISARIGELRALERATMSVFSAIERFQLELTACMDGLRDFEHRQNELKADMEVRLDELWQLGEFYDGFVGAYDEMILEVARRRGVEARMEAIVRDASAMLADLHDEDLQKRESFKEKNGRWLPVDLWAGSNDPPVRWTIEKDLQGGRELPVLGKDVIARAAAGRGVLQKGI